MAQKKDAKRILARLCFAVYCGLMLWLLFGRSPYDASYQNWEQLRQNVNLVPFDTVKLYLHVLEEPSLSGLIPHAVVNLAGNIVMFIPMGILLPAVFPKLNRFWKTVAVTALVIALVELAQLVMLVGSCDVDDLLLNVMGSAIGYGIFRLSKK